VKRGEPADVCLVLEGTYPYVAGGVSGWTHDLVTNLPHLRFHLLALVPPDADLEPRYELPANVCGLTVVTLQALEEGSSRLPRGREFFAAVESSLETLLAGGGLDAFARLDALFEPRRARLGRELLLNSRSAWQMLLDMYRGRFAESSFLDYFWSWRALMGGLFSALLGPLPPARVYHTVSTGYAGLYAARASLATGRPCLVTEHGIYTNERRIEIAMADWLYELPTLGLSVERTEVDLKDFWMDAFAAYSLVCYQAASRIITLYEGNQRFQIEDGADPERLRVVPNGIDFARYSAIRRGADPHPPTIALIGRVVPIKDVKTFVRACARLRETVPDLRALVMGPTDEDPDYFDDCKALIAHSGLESCIEFTGRVRLDDHLGRVDVIVLTSISEAQPLVLLEAGAAGIPSVATDVGSCREIILGRGDESPPLGAGGAVTMLADPEATALACERLLTDADWYRRCSEAIRERVRRYYQDRDVVRIYDAIYREHAALPTRDRITA